MMAKALIFPLIAAFSVATFGQDHGSLLLKISNKEKELAEVQKELLGLRNQLNSPVSKSYRVKSGETIHSIARSNKVSASNLLQWNKITDPTKLRVGEKIIISRPLPASIAAPSPVEEESLSAKTTDYNITTGDTFYSIARRHKMSLAELRALNPNVNIHLLSPGKKIRIAGSPTSALPTVRSQEVMVIKAIKKPAGTISTPRPTPTQNNATLPANQTTTKQGSRGPKDLPAPPSIEEHETTSTTRSIILTEVITFEAFAVRHGTSTKQLNALNGWKLPKATILADGSEILVPK